MEFKDRIKSARGALTQKEFADKLDVHVTTVQLYETGNIPKGDILLRIHKEFGIDITWLLTGEPEMPPDKELDMDCLVREPVVEYERGNDPFANAVSGLKQIFDSHDQILITAIQVNIKSFQLSIQKDRQIQQQSTEIQNLKSELDDLRKRLDSLEKRDVGNAEAGSGSHAHHGDATREKES